MKRRLRPVIAATVRATTMKRRSSTTGAKELARMLRTHPKVIGREMGSVLVQAARELAYQYSRETDPPDVGGDTAVEGFKQRIEAEVKAVFPTRAAENAVYRLMKKHAPHLAAAYWHAYKSQKPRRMADLMRQAALPQNGASVGVLKERRTGRRGRVVKGKDAAGLVRPQEQRKLVREQQGKVGTAKAGWHQAGRALGGRTRRNMTGKDGWRWTVEKYPAYVRKVSRKFSGLGGAIVGPSRVTIFTNVRHAVEALGERRKAGAEAEAEQRFQRAMAIAVERANVRVFGTGSSAA